MAIKSKYKKILSVVGLVAACAGVYALLHSSQKVDESATISKFQLSSAAETAMKTTDKVLELPSSEPANKGTKVIWQVFQWNSQFPLMYANGGVNTTVGSLMEKAGVDINIVVQPDCFKTIADFIANAKQIHDNPQTVPMIISFMGDGVPGFSVALKEIQKLGPDYTPIVFYHMGRSNGEDGFWGPQEWKKNPKAACGKSVAGVERDGDINIVLKWAADNGIPINAQTKYYDPNALNIIPCTDFIEAGNKYITGYSEQRVLIRNGKTIPDSMITVNTDAYTSWTPVDVTVAEKKGGLVRLASTKEYSSQMPNASIILKKWAYEHRNEMEGIIKALGSAGDQVRSFTSAQEFAAKVSAEVYNEKEHPASYWLKYYRGVEEKDAQGIRVQLGGSQAFNLADAANTVGLGPDKIDRYKVTYETFGRILEKLYPKEMKGWMKYEEIVDKSFIKSVLFSNEDLASSKTEVDQTEYSSDISSEVSNKAYNIQFDLGKSTVKSASFADLDEIYRSAIVSEGLTIGIYGHTDASGDPDANQVLSEQRAQAVADYLLKKGIKSVRIKVKGYGESNPIQGTEATDPRNRCVEIVQGS